MKEKVGTDYFDRAYWQDGTKSGYRDYNRAWPLHRAIAMFLQQVLDPKPGWRVLDWGGAFGYHVSLLGELTGCRPYLADASAWAVEHCDPAVQGRAHCLDFGTTPLPWPEGFFDAALAVEIMEHLYEPEVPYALGELVRVLRPGGLLYASVATEFDTDKDHDLTHQTERPLVWWMSQLLQAGFVIREDLIGLAYETRVSVDRYGEVPLACEPGLRWNIVVAERSTP
jgi:SAM-dependent methyltransferase